MALTYTYSDAYLSPLVTDAREARAISDVAGQLESTAPLPAFWKQRMVVLCCYIITCRESQRTPDDLFTAKLKSYGAEWDKLLPSAVAARDAAAAGTTSPVGGGSFFTIALERS
jgi:hypothetical protein